MELAIRNTALMPREDIFSFKSAKSGSANHNNAICKKRLDLQVENPQIAAFVESLQIQLIGKSASLRICDFRNFFADRPTLVIFMR
jgi:hypothetical protein